MSLPVQRSSQDRVEARIVDAAYTQVMKVGFRRTTLTDVAERAGLSRMTVYRRFPDVASVLQALMWREFGAILARAQAERAAVAGGRERVIALAVHGLELLSTHELFLRLLDVDPEMLLPYITQRAGRFQDAVTEELTAQLSEAMSAGEVRADDPGRLARSMLLAMRGYAYSAADGTSRKQRERQRGDLARMLDGLLRPASEPSA